MIKLYCPQGHEVEFLKSKLIKSSVHDLAHCNTCDRPYLKMDCLDEAEKELSSNSEQLENDKKKISWAEHLKKSCPESYEELRLGDCVFSTGPVPRIVLNNSTISAYCETHKSWDCTSQNPKEESLNDIDAGQRNVDDNNVVELTLGDDTNVATKNKENQCDHQWIDTNITKHNGLIQVCLNCDETIFVEKELNK